MQLVMTNLTICVMISLERTLHENLGLLRDLVIPKLKLPNNFDIVELFMF